MNYDTLADVHNATMLSLIVGIPAWVIFMPPRFMRSWPSVFRPFLAIVCSMVTIYGIFHAVTIPAFAAWASAHPQIYYILDGPFVLYPRHLWLPATLVCAAFFSLLLCSHFLRRYKRHDAPIPTNRNA